MNIWLVRGKEVERLRVVFMAAAWSGNSQTQMTTFILFFHCDSIIWSASMKEHAFAFFVKAEQKHQGLVCPAINCGPSMLSDLSDRVATHGGSGSGSCSWLRNRFQSYQVCGGSLQVVDSAKIEQIFSHPILWMGKAAFSKWPKQQGQNSRSLKLKFKSNQMLSNWSEPHPHHTLWSLICEDLSVANLHFQLLRLARIGRIGRIGRNATELCHWWGSRHPWRWWWRWG